jgi:SAM-dependent methyltransferase
LDPKGECHLVTLHDFSKSQGEPSIWKKFAEHYYKSLRDPRAFRNLQRLGKVEGYLALSHAYLLDSFENGLSPEPRRAFQKLRAEYGLDTASLDKADAGEMHCTSQYDSGGGFLPSDKKHHDSTEFIDAAYKGDAPQVHYVTPPQGGWFQQRIPTREEYGGLETIALLAKKSDDEHIYNVERNFLDYVGIFPPSFAEKLLSLGSDSHVIDMGSGEGLFVEGVVTPPTADKAWKEKPDSYVFKDEDETKERARLNDFLAQWTAKKERPYATGITLKMSREKPKHEKLGFLTDYLDNVTDKALTQDGKAGKADVITDVYGVFSYAPDTTAVLQRYVDLLKPGGKIFISGNVKGVVVRPDGSRMRLLDWVATIPGLKVTQHGPTDGRIAPAKKVLEIELESKTAPKIPKLDPVGRGTEDPPLMIFKVDN